MTNTGFMRCASITFTWGLDDSYKKIISAEEDRFLAVPVVIKKSRHINNNPLLILGVGAVNGEYIITPGEQSITAWDSITSKLFNCKYGNTCRKNYCAFVNCQVHRGTHQVISELNKINQDGYPKHLEIRLFSENDKYYDEAVVTRDADYQAIAKSVQQFEREHRLSVMQVAVHNSKKFTVKPQMPPKQRAATQPQPTQKPQKFQVNELEFYKKNARTAIQMLRDFLGSGDYDDAVQSELEEVISVLSGEKTKQEELNKIESDFEAFLEKQKAIFEEKKNAVLHRQAALTQGLMNSAQTADSNSQTTTVVQTQSSTTTDGNTPRKSWAEMVDEDES